MNKIQSTFLTIAILATTVFVVGAYSNPSLDKFDTAGNPKDNPSIVGVTTEGSSQVKTHSLSLQKTFFARGNATFEDQVLLTGPVYGGKESAQIGDRVLSVGAPGETSLTSVFAMNNIKTSAKLQTRNDNVLAGGGTVPVCSDKDGFVVLCGETPPIPPPPVLLPAVVEIRAQMVSGGGPSRVACYITLTESVAVPTMFTYRFNTGSSNAPYTEKEFTCSVTVPAGRTLEMAETRNNEFAGRYIFEPSTCVQSFPQDIVSVPQTMKCN